MESYDFNWLNQEDDLMESLIGIASLPDEPMSQAPGNDIINYLLQNETSNAVKENEVHRQEELQHAISCTIDNPSLPLDVLQGKDNFVTFMPSTTTTTTKKRATPKKPKFKEPIFVTESPQSFSKKNKKSSHSNSSGDDISDDEMLANDNDVSSSLKQMTSKERRQLRNKISARNFRVRRKEYINQLEEKVEEYEKTIDELRKENEKLRKSNEEFMKQMLNNPITPPSASSPSSDESLVSSSSSSEGHLSPEIPPNMFQFQLTDLYDMNLFDHPQQPTQPPINASNLFYLNHMHFPGWDISQILGGKEMPTSTKDEDKELSKDLADNYPLLAPALMSIVLRHTLSMEYVSSIIEDLKMELVSYSKSKTSDDEETVLGDELDDLKASLNNLRIQDNPDKKQSSDEFNNEDFVNDLLSNHFAYYCYMRARGKTHEEVIEHCKECLSNPNSPCMIRKRKNEEKKRAKQEKKANCNSNIKTLQAYCRVAGELLRNPQRMSRVRHVLKENIDFKNTKHKFTNSIESSSHNNRITNGAH